MYKIKIPNGANSIITGLQREGHEAYVVGGCVRDSLIGREPHDWDICTSATPVESRRYLNLHGIHTVDTGLRHGTITANFGSGELYEVTTFRVDGDYSDNRHPDTVTFIDSVTEDLSRRDFTINAMAYNDAGLIDPFNGCMDLENGVIACVGNPDDRFTEDALRILRALRFASTYNFRIDKKTALSIHKNRDGLRNIAAERIQAELCKMIFGTGILQVLIEFSDVIAVIIPEFEPCIGFEQNNRYHQHTVYNHIAHAVSNYTGDDLSVKVALLLHDIGKPNCHSEDENGGHFYGHAVPSRDIAESVLNRLRFDNKTKAEVLELVLYHDATIEPTPKTVRKWLNRVGEHRFKQLLGVRMADILAHAEGTQESRIDRCHSLALILESTINEQHCFSIKDLSICGKDILSFGVPESKLVGDTLQHILDMVMNEEIDNHIENQMEEARRYLEDRKDEWCGWAELSKR